MKKCEMCCNDHNGEYGSGRFCCSFCARKFSTHKDRLKINEKVSECVNRKISSGIILPKRDITKNIEVICPVCKKPFSKWISETLIYCSRKCYLEDSECEFRKRQKSGGFRSNSGRSRSGYYGGIWCQSTYELAYVIYNVDHKIEFKRNDEFFIYIKDGKNRKYFPDFVENGVIIEIKGWHTDDVDLKVSSVNRPIKVMYKEDLKYAFDYVSARYKKPLLQLYEDYKPRFSYSCVNCCKNFETDKKRVKENKFCSRRCAGLYITAKNSKDKNDR